MIRLRRDMDLEKKKRLLDLKSRWNSIRAGLTIVQVETIMGFKLNIESTRASGRVVYAHYTNDPLPFYVVVDAEIGLVVRKHEIRSLSELNN